MNFEFFKSADSEGFGGGKKALMKSRNVLGVENNPAEGKGEMAVFVYLNGGIYVCIGIVMICCAYIFIYFLSWFFAPPLYLPTASLCVE